MEYSNPRIPEGINTSKEHPLKEFVILTSGVLFIIIAIISGLVITVDYFADKIPFEWEKSIPVTRLSQFQGDTVAQTLPPYLDSVSKKVIQKMELPEGMEITVHYVNSDLVNAFATLGGHVFLYRGLLEKLTYEEELAMVIGHEAAHIRHRHPILSTSHSIVVGIVLSVVSTSSADAINDLLGTTGQISLLKFSRDFEYEADEDAIAVLIELYGHADAAVSLFELFKSQMTGAEPVEFLSTHPLNDNRITRTRKLSQQVSSQTDVAMTPLDKSFVDWLQQQKRQADRTE